MQKKTPRLDAQGLRVPSTAVPTGEESCKTSRRKGCYFLLLSQ